MTKKTRSTKAWKRNNKKQAAALKGLEGASGEK